MLFGFNGRLNTDGVVEASLSDRSQADRPGDTATYAKEQELYEETRLEALLGKYRGREKRNTFAAN